MRAARLLQREAACSLGADIALRKQIPMGGGFGGGSSDAASVLVGLNRLWRLGLELDYLADIGLQLGADVPVFLRGFSAWAEGVGEQLQPMSLPPAWYVLVDCGEQIATAELFQAAELTRNAARLTMADFVSSMVGQNAFEPLLRARSARLAAVLDAIAQLGVGGLTGTGGGCYLQVESQTQASRAAAQLASLGRCEIAQGLARSPLFDLASGAALKTASAGQIETQNWDWWGVAKW